MHAGGRQQAGLQRREASVGAAWLWAESHGGLSALPVSMCLPVQHAIMYKSMSAGGANAHTPVPML